MATSSINSPVFDWATIGKLTNAEEVARFLPPEWIIDTLGVERVIEIIGVGRIIEAIGVERVLDIIGLQCVIDTLGPEKLLAELLARLPAGKVEELLRQRTKTE